MQKLTIAQVFEECCKLFPTILQDQIANGRIWEL